MVKAVEIKKLAERLSKAEAIVAAGGVHRIAGAAGYFAVQSSCSDAMYLVHLHDDGHVCCSCRDYQDRQSKIDQPCKHIIASELYAAAPKAAAEPKPKRSKTSEAAPQAEAPRHVAPGEALARAMGDPADMDPWNRPAAA